MLLAARIVRRQGNPDAAAGLYGASFVSRGQFDEATTTSDLESARDLTNMLVVASGGTLAVGLSVGYIGIMMDGSPGLQFGGRFCARTPAGLRVRDGAGPSAGRVGPAGATPALATLSSSRLRKRSRADA